MIVISGLPKTQHVLALVAELKSLPAPRVFAIKEADRELAGLLVANDIAHIIPWRKLFILEITTASDAQGIRDSLCDFFISNNYNSQCLQSGKSQSFRFEAPEDRQDIPSIIEIFSEGTVPNSDRWVHRIPDADMSYRKACPLPLH